MHMHPETYAALPRDVKDEIDGSVELNSLIAPGEVREIALVDGKPALMSVMPAPEFVKHIRARRKRERQNRKAGRKANR